VFAEGGAIVVSILLAFAIQAWWEGRQEHSEEERLLQAVLEDMRSNRDLISDVSSYHEAVLASERRILSLAGTSPAQIQIESADSLIGDIAWWYGSTHWRTGGLEALTQGGRLEVVSNEDLRHTLASWARVIANVQMAEDQESEFFNDALMPFLNREAWVPQIAEVAQVLPGTDQRPGYGRVNWATEIRDHRSLLLAPSFQNLVLQRLWVQVDILSAYEGFSDQLQELISLIEAELE
jgi:hypothetical protein